jgi:hypothetical protein
VKIRLDWKGGAQHAPFYLARRRGITGRGLDLDVISGSGSSDTIKQIGSKAVEFGLVDAWCWRKAQQRVPAKSIAAYYQTTPIVLISPQAKLVTNPRQLLDGIKLGSKGSATFQGLSPCSPRTTALEQIKLVDIGFGVQPLVKQVDAIMGFSMNERSRPRAEDGNSLAGLDYGVNTYGLTIASIRLHAAEARGGEGLHESDAAIRRRDCQGSRRRVSAVAAAVAETDAKREAKAGAHGAILSKDTETGGFGWQTGRVA